MHRSGTSLCSHVLTHLGVDMAASSDAPDSGLDAIVLRELRRSSDKSSVHTPLFDRMYQEIVGHFRDGGARHLHSPATKQFGVIRQVNRGLEAMLQLHTDRLQEIFELERRAQMSGLEARCAALEAAAAKDRLTIAALTAERDALYPQPGAISARA